MLRLFFYNIAVAFLYFSHRYNRGGIGTILSSGCLSVSVSVIEVCQQVRAYLVNHLRKFYQFYNIGTFRDKNEMVWFEISVSQFEGITRLRAGCTNNT